MRMKLLDFAFGILRASFGFCIERSVQVKITKNIIKLSISSTRKRLKKHYSLQNCTKNAEKFTIILIYNISYS